MSSGQADSSDPSTLPQRPVVQHLGRSEGAAPAGRSGSRTAGGPCPHHRMSPRPAVRPVALEHQLCVRGRKRSSGHSGGNPPDRVRFGARFGTFRHVTGGFRAKARRYPRCAARSVFGDAYRQPVFGEWPLSCRNASKGERGSRRIAREEQRSKDRVRFDVNAKTPDLYFCRSGAFPGVPPGGPHADGCGAEQRVLVGRLIVEGRFRPAVWGAGVR